MSCCHGRRRRGHGLSRFCASPPGANRASDARWRRVAVLVLGPAAVLLAPTLATVPLDLPMQRRFGFEGGGAPTPGAHGAPHRAFAHNRGLSPKFCAAPSGPSRPARARRARRSAWGRDKVVVVIPQALRVAVPPLASQYLNLAKSSSLAVAIGYPDLMSVGNTIRQTGQALEVDRQARPRLSHAQPRDLSLHELGTTASCSGRRHDRRARNTWRRFFGSIGNSLLTLGMLAFRQHSQRQKAVADAAEEAPPRPCERAGHDMAPNRTRALYQFMKAEIARLSVR